MQIQVNNRYAASVLKRGAAALTVAGLGIFCTATAALAAKPGQPDVYIEVNPFHDSGGAGYKGPDGKPLTERLVSALRYGIADHAKIRYKVADPTDEHVVTKDAIHYVVEADISALEIGEPATRPYLLVARLYRDGKPRKLVAQFAGNAPNLRDLTGNMMNQSGVSNAGLTGEMAKGILDAAENTRPLAEAFDAMVEGATNTRRLTVDVMADVNGKQEPRQAIPAGGKYRLRVSSQDAGAVYVVAIDPASKRPISPYAQDEALDVAPGQPVVLPPNDPFVAPTKASIGSLEYIVFVRKRVSSAAGLSVPTESLAAQNDDASIIRRSTTPRLKPRDAAALCGIDPNTTSNGTSIELLSSVSPQSGTLDPGVAKLLSQYQEDPEGTWTAVRVKVAITPSDGGGAGNADSGSGGSRGAGTGSGAKPGGVSPR